MPAAVPRGSRSFPQEREPLFHARPTQLAPALPLIPTRAQPSLPRLLFLSPQSLSPVARSVVTHRAQRPESAQNPGIKPIPLPAARPVSTHRAHPTANPTNPINPPHPISAETNSPLVFIHSLHTHSNPTHSNPPQLAPVSPVPPLFILFVARSVVTYRARRPESALNPGIKPIPLPAARPVSAHRAHPDRKPINPTHLNPPQLRRPARRAYADR